MQKMPESIRFLSVRGYKQEILKTFQIISEENGKSIPSKELQLDESDARGHLSNLLVSPYFKLTVSLGTAG